MCTVWTLLVKVFGFDAHTYGYLSQLDKTLAEMEKPANASNWRAHQSNPQIVRQQLEQLRTQIANEEKIFAFTRQQQDNDARAIERISHYKVDMMKKR